MWVQAGVSPHCPDDTKASLLGIPTLKGLGDKTERTAASETKEQCHRRKILKPTGKMGQTSLGMEPSEVKGRQPGAWRTLLLVAAWRNSAIALTAA